MRSQARKGTSWKRATTDEIRVCCRRTACGIEKGVGASENVGQKGEEIELHRQAVLAGGHQIGFERAQRALVGLAVFVAELVPAGPPAGADHVQSGIVNLGEILVPHIHVGMLEIKALHFARHVSRADDRERMAVEFEVVVVDAEMRAGAEIGFVADPEAGMIDGADAVALQQLRLDDVEALAVGSRAARRGRSGVAVTVERFEGWASGNVVIFRRDAATCGCTAACHCTCSSRARHGGRAATPGAR